MYNHIMKKVHFNNSQLTVVLIAVVFVLVGGLILGQALGRNSTRLADLPKPEVSEGQRGQLGIDKNINEATIDLYLNRSDSVYYDMRMLEDPANYEAIEDGDRYLSGIVEGFEVLPLPYLVNVNGMLPEAVGKSYDGKTLFVQNDEGKYDAKYQESQQILEDLFPKDKYIFLMCGGGGYAGMTKDLLVSQGWDENKIYVVGGYWYYTGDHNIEIKRTGEDGKVSYAFWKLKYHDIDFSKLTEK